MAISNASNGLRPGVCTSTTRPQAPFEGQMIYETDTNRVLVWDNAAWVMIADTNQPPGLQLVKTQTIGTGVSSVTVTDAFSADYDNYRIIVSDVTASTASNMLFRFSSGGTPVNGANYAVAGFFLSGSSTLGGKYSQTDTNFEAFRLNTDSTNNGVFDLLGPYLAKYTNAFGLGGLAGTVAYNYQGRHLLATSYSDFELSTSSGTMTGGTIRVYGYRN